MANDGASYNRETQTMATQPTHAPGERIVITDIDIPFWRLVVILVKWALAAIPATIVVMLIVMLVAAVFSGIFGLGMMMQRPI
jgi:hypothetical protein